MKRRTKTENALSGRATGRDIGTFRLKNDTSNVYEYLLPEITRQTRLSRTPLQANNGDFTIRAVVAAGASCAMHRHAAVKIVPSL